MLMQYNAQVIRGWPYDGALDRAEVIGTGVTLSNGDWVIKQSDNTVVKATATKTNSAGLVLRGNGDSLSALVSIGGNGVSTTPSNQKRAIVLWGNFIAQIQNLPNAVTFTPGAPITIQNGMIQLGTFGTDPIIGFVLDVIGASSTTTASVVVKIG